MKKKNILGALLLSSVMFVGCAEDEIVMNTSDAKVGFATSEYTVKESDGIIQIPINVTGEQNGAVDIVLKVEEYGNNPAKQNVNYFLTDNTLRISAEDKTISAEFSLADDEEINEARTFVVKIESANGATIDEAANACIVTIKDNDANFYEKLGGKWKLTAGATSYDATITIYGESNPKYEKEMILGFALQGVNLQFTMNYSFDIASKKITLTMPTGELLAEGLNFGASLGVCDAYSCIIKGNDLSFDTLEWEVSEDIKNITIKDESLGLAAALFETGTENFTRYTWFNLSNPVLSK